MPRKVRPRWGDDGVTEFPDFALSPEQAEALAGLLGLTRDEDVVSLTTELEEIAVRYLRWSAQDEGGPSRAERNAALKDVADASRRLQDLLGVLDHASGAELIDALPPYGPASRKHDGEGQVAAHELGFRQIRALQDRLAHFNHGIDRLLKDRKKRGGPEPRKTLPQIISYLAEVYERETGEAVTHNPNKGVGNYTGLPQSKAGQFITAFFKIVDPELPETTISTALSRHVKGPKT